MSARSVLALPRRAALPPYAWWALLLVVTIVQIRFGPVAGLSLLAFALIQVLRPLDFINALALVCAGASFANYTAGGGALMTQLSLVTAGILFMLFCYTLARGKNLLALADSPLSGALLAYVGLSLLQAFRGAALDYDRRFVGLDVLPVLALGCAFLVANAPFGREKIARSLGWLWLISLGHVALGLAVFAEVGRRVGSIYFTPITGVVAMLMLAFALRASSRPRMFGWVAAMLPLVTHQFLSFTRGYWLALIGGFLFSIVAYGGRGPGCGARWRRCGVLVAGLLLFGTLAVGAMSAALGITGVAQMAGARIASATGTGFTYETAANFARLVEYRIVLEEIARSPWLGHGLGYSFMVLDPLPMKRLEQWYTHQNYLMVWVKQGLLGLLAFCWMLVAAARLGGHGNRLDDPWKRAWCAGAAAVAVYMIVYSMVEFPLGQVNVTFVVAFIWGGAMALTSRGNRIFRWRRPREGDGRSD